MHQVQILLWGKNISIICATLQFERSGWLKMVPLLETANECLNTSVVLIMLTIFL